MKISVISTLLLLLALVNVTFAKKQGPRGLQVDETEFDLLEKKSKLSICESLSVQAAQLSAAIQACGAIFAADIAQGGGAVDLAVPSSCTLLCASEQIIFNLLNVNGCLDEPPPGPVPTSFC